MSEEKVIEEINNDEVFETLKTNFIDEERLLLRLKSFYNDLLDYEDDCTEVEDREGEIVRKAGKIAEKLLLNVVDNSQYKLESFTTYPIESKLNFTIQKDEDTSVKYSLIVEDEGFELEEVIV
jgi:hypothetical protein